MTIKPMVYENLTDAQRVAAVIDALAREDHKEAVRILEGIERKAYEMPDATFADELVSKILAHEAITDKAAAYTAIQRIVRRPCLQDRQSIQVSIVHKRSATWPPEDVDPSHEVSDEYV